MSYRILDRIRIKGQDEEMQALATLKEYKVYISANLVDPDSPGNIFTIDQSCWTVTKNEKLKNLIAKFKNMHNLSQFDLTISYNHRLYTNAELTFGDIKIKNNTQIELVSLESEKAATENEGFIFSFWSVVPLMLAASFLIAGLGGRFDIIVRGIYILIGTIIVIPSFVIFVVGVSQKFSKHAQTAFVNHIWFGDCDRECCCCCCGYDKDSQNVEEDLSDEIKQLATNAQTNNYDLIL